MDNNTVSFTNAQAWFLERYVAHNPHRWNFTLFRAVSYPLDPTLLQQTVQYLIQRHDALRLRFVQQGPQWQQFITEAEDSLPIVWISLSGLSEAEQVATIISTAADLQGSLNLFNGPLMQIVYFNPGFQKPGYILWILHHLITDPYSNEILLQEFQEIYQQLSQGKVVHLPERTSSLRDFGERWTALSQSLEAQRALEYWLTLPWSKIATLPLDEPRGITANTVETEQVVTTSLNMTSTFNSTISTRMHIPTMLLTALVQTLSIWTGSSVFNIHIVGHGRLAFNDMDLSYTVGSLAFGIPMLINIDHVVQANDVVTAVKSQIKSLSSQGNAFSALYYSNRNLQIIKKAQTLPISGHEVYFNYLGRDTQTISKAALLQRTGKLGDTSIAMQDAQE